PAGDVVAVGDGVTRFRPGDRVVLHQHAPCLDGEACRRGDSVHCPAWRAQALLPGGLAAFAEGAQHRARPGTPPPPAHVSYEAGTLVEPLACVVKALKRARFAPGMRVLVIGRGFIGQLFGFPLRRRGAGRLVGSDAVSRRLALAREHWADEVYDVSRPPAAPRLTSAVPEQAFDLVVVTPGSPKAMLEGIKYVRSGGTLLLFAP